MVRLPLLEVEVVSGDAEVVDDICNDSPGHVTSMVGESDQSFGMERVRIVTVAPARADKITADLPEATLQLAAVVRGILAHA